MSTGGPGHTHRFDPVSGWCWYCNSRDDGRLVGKGGEVFRPGHEYTPAELDYLRNRIKEQTR